MKEFVEQKEKEAYERGKSKASNPVLKDEDTFLGFDRALTIVKEAKGRLPGYQGDDGIYECDHAIKTLEKLLRNGTTD